MPARARERERRASIFEKKKKKMNENGLSKRRNCVLALDSAV